MDAPRSTNPRPAPGAAPLSPPRPRKRKAPAKLPSARAQELRVTWFLVGSASGIALTWIASAAGLVPLPPPRVAPVETTISQPQKDQQSQAESTKSAENPAPEVADAADTVRPKGGRALDLPAALNLEVGNGDTLLTLLTDTGVTLDEAYQAVEALRRIYNPRQLDIGQQLALELDAHADDPAIPTLTRLSLPISKIATIELKRAGNGFTAKKLEAPVTKKLVRLDAPIRGSFYQTGANAGIPVGTLNELVKVYSYDIDFQRDLHPGHRLEVLVERLQTAEGVTVGYGNVVYASLEMGKRRIPVYRFTDAGGNTSYYNEKGESLRKALLRTPINGAHITSGFGMRRHPILGYSKMHRGVDFGASTGTPIYAAGDGIVKTAGYQGGYGNYVKIQHDKKYSTAYGHASRIAPGIRPGVRVRQGQVIAYVGSTGRSTGPHLHYEVMVNGAQVNPAGVKFKTGQSLAGADLKRFKARVGEVRTALQEQGGAQKVASR